MGMEETFFLSEINSEIRKSNQLLAAILRQLGGNPDALPALDKRGRPKDGKRRKKG